ncbi:SusD/RagB family nutrient-binding outer membrane lipoprotein [Draconibacterium sp. IB214405]|uniref:SusD/RagB family nutrient-binding outer membrane lipoprotein n=1 Tax=Draconibacterium sp. IB214405 TaxID=3097352 RepID=UPI002A0F4C37|nr:SusD/RagB family nutrient-binding outer membrane lipoprotein [Draconibacterium sp. IB214405]MDX8340835.1 SusD/RagB family nutrient-binding outer membrane lipoprotein [Draconibacterium sp. IB214405]
MKRYIKKSVFALLFASLFVGCTKDFEEINTDPNNVTDVPTAYLMTNAQRSILGNRFNTTCMLYSQHWSETQYTNTSRYQTAEASFNSYYTGPLADLEQIIAINTDEATMSDATASGSNANQIAVARILKVYTFQLITDMWGEIPYSDALKGSESFKPTYDTQDAIYASFVTELTEAAAQIEVNAAGMEGDIIFGGDMAAWKKFANSLKARVGIRMTEVDAAAAKSAVVSGLAGGFTSNDDNALYSYLADAANWNPIYNHFLTRTDYAISNTMADYMAAINDPRLPVYADPAPNTGTVVGMPYGVSDAESGSITNAEISFPGAAVRAAESPGVMQTYSELLFIKAEAAARGWISDDPATVYEEAITASMEFWGIDAAATADYLAQEAVAYDAANYKKSIGEQKWVSLYMDGQESWSEWRRLDYPELAPAPAAYQDREIPRRRAYTQNEFDLNEENVTAAVARQGADDMDTRIWWDK